MLLLLMLLLLLCAEFVVNLFAPFSLALLHADADFGVGGLA